MEQPGGGSCDHPAAAASDGQEPEGAVVLWAADCVTSVDSCSVIAVESCPCSSFRSCLHW